MGERNTHDLRGVMASNYKTPGVYVVEQNAFPNSVVEVATAVPVFIGYTQVSQEGTQDVLKKPVRLSSMREFESIYGKASVSKLAFQNGTTPAQTKLAYADEKRYLLWPCMRLFFDNGGGPCYVISVGHYQATPVINRTDLWNDDLQDALERELEPTMIVIPEATQLESEDWQGVSVAATNHCIKMQSRITILDVVGGDKGNPKQLTEANLISEHAAEFRKINLTKPSYAVGYYPWLNTTIFADEDVDFRAFTPDARGQLCDAASAEAVDLFGDGKPKATGIKNACDIIKGFDASKDPSDAVMAAHQSLAIASPLYKATMHAARPMQNLLPPSAAMAGVYTNIDHLFGVFRAPANTGLASVASPSINITSAEQEDLNMPLDGKAINAIRTLPGRGLTIWGARTLDGNSQDWRYVNVRRTMIMLEQSIKAAAQAYVFQPNTETTWVTVSAMISNYLTNKWKDGALMGSTPEQAFSVDVGLGTTMSSNDILDGYMRVTIKVAIVRPAEFIELTFVQKMQTAS